MAPKRKASGEASNPALKKTKPSEPENPPMHSLREIFAHMTLKALDLGLGNALEHLGSRKLQIATMCSGTEAPILALNEIQEGRHFISYVAIVNLPPN